MSNKVFYCVDGHLPKVELRMENEHLLLGWENIVRVKASADCLTISFECEFGHVQFFAAEPMTELFEALQMENLRIIDGTQLNCQIIERNTASSE